MPIIQKTNEAPRVIGRHEQAQVVEFLEKYLDHKTGYPESSDAFWFFKPWRTPRSVPKESRVYATIHVTHHGCYYGFSYYVAECQRWLMSSASAVFAQATADTYHAVVKAGKLRESGAYLSAHQEKRWSEAPLEGISELPYWCRDREDQLQVNDEALNLALLRYAVDPELKRKTAAL